MKSAEDTLRKKRDESNNRGGDEGDASEMSRALDSIGTRSVTNGGVGNHFGADDQAVSTSHFSQELDLSSLAFRDGSHTMTNKKCDLPDQSWRATKPGYEEVHAPATRSVMPADEKLVPITDLPAWTQDAFAGMKMLNRVQSKMADMASRKSKNMLLCAPTVTMLSILNVLGQYRNESADDNHAADAMEVEGGDTKVEYNDIN